MIGPIVNFIVQNHLGDVASVVGVLIAAVGFTITIISVLRSKGAAERAEQATRDAIAAIARNNAIASCATAISAMERIKTLHRERDWNALLEKYAEAKKLLVSIREGNPNLKPTHKTALSGALTQLGDMEDKVEKYLGSGKGEPRTEKFNSVLSKQIEGVFVIQIYLSTSTGESDA